jgi:hypothetical protein
MTGIELIVKERNKQIAKKYTSESDQKYIYGELVRMAQLFLLSKDDAESDELIAYLFDNNDGPQLNESLLRTWENSDSIESLTIAGTLIAAEIDRLQNQ